MTVHQISECWFQIAINELKQVDNLLAERPLNALSIENRQLIVFLRTKRNGGIGQQFMNSFLFFFRDGIIIKQ